MFEAKDVAKFLDERLIKPIRDYLSEIISTFKIKRTKESNTEILKVETRDFSVGESKEYTKHNSSSNRHYEVTRISTKEVWELGFDKPEEIQNSEEKGKLTKLDDDTSS